MYFVVQRITSINGEICPSESKEATQKIKDASDALQIVAIDLPEEVAEAAPKVAATTAGVASTPPKEEEPQETPNEETKKMGGTQEPDLSC